MTRRTLRAALSLKGRGRNFRLVACGDLAFPIEVVILRSESGNDFSGGEFLTEQR